MTVRITAAKLTLAMVLATAALATTSAQADEAAGTGPDNVVWATTTGANATDERANLQLGWYDGDNLQSANVARADSHDCTDCRTVAVAVQTVFVTGNPTTSSPQNVALAINQNCLRCTTYAYAWQYVVTTDRPIHVRRDDRRRLAELRQEIDDVAHSGLAPDELDARLNALTAELRSGVDDALRHTGERPGGRIERDEETGPQQ
jgi:hypothetical protein